MTKVQRYKVGYYTDEWEYFDAPTGDDCPKCVPLIVKPEENK